MDSLSFFQQLNNLEPRPRITATRTGGVMTEQPEQSECEATGSTRDDQEREKREATETTESCYARSYFRSGLTILCERFNSLS